MLCPAHMLIHLQLLLLPYIVQYLLSGPKVVHPHGNIRSLIIDRNG